MSKNHEIEICILAGGNSRRMGRDKALVRVGGRTLLSWVKALARDLGYRVRVIRRDLVVGLGPVGGVYTALRTTSAERLLFLSCDMPFVPSRLLVSLLRAMDEGAKGVFVCHGERVGFPFALRADELPRVEHLMGEERATLQKLALATGAGVVSPAPDEMRLLLNLNTPEDLKAARAILRKRSQGTGPMTDVPGHWLTHGPSNSGSKSQ